MKNALELTPKYWASVSGGKDSLFMLQLILTHPDEFPIDGVVHFELEIDYPFITDVVQLMKNECAKRDIKFVSIKPRVSYWDLYSKYLMPTRKCRWCNSQYKLDALRQLKDYLKQYGHYLVNYIGYCADETKRFEKRDHTTEIYPLVKYGINENVILEWARTQSIFNDYYIYNDRCGCMYCPMSTHKNLLYLKKYYPEHFEKFMSMAHETEVRREKELGHSFSVWQSNPKYNTEYLIKRLEEKEKNAK